MVRNSLGFLQLLCFVSVLQWVLSHSTHVDGSYTSFVNNVLIWYSFLPFQLSSHRYLLCFARVTVLSQTVNFPTYVSKYFTSASSAGISVLVWILGELVRHFSGVSNVWSGFQWIRWPDHDFVNRVSPAHLLESPSKRSTVPWTILCLLSPLISSLV